MRYLVTVIFSLFTLISSTFASAPIQVEIYTIPGCPGCGMAKSFFEDRKIPYTEINLQGRRDLYRQMKERVNATLPDEERRPMEESMNVPKVFINGVYVPTSQLDEHLEKLTAQVKGNSTKVSTTTENSTNNNNES
jgi:glutaredoxin